MNIDFISTYFERAEYLDVTAEVWLPRPGVKFMVENVEAFCLVIYDGDYTQPSFESEDNDILEVGFDNVEFVPTA